MGVIEVFEEFHDPLLAAVYDTTCPFGPDHQFYLDLAEELDASGVIDIGSGTGLLTVEFANQGCDTTGVEPAEAMLALAREREGGDAVRWVLGEATDLPKTVPNGAADLVVMSAHVAQMITDDEVWAQTLSAAAGVLRPGGHLAFESRPDAKQHGLGDRQGWLGSFDAPGSGEFVTWIDAVTHVGNLASYELHYRFVDGAHLISHNQLRYRTQAQLSAQVEAAGFTVVEVFGDFDRSPVGEQSEELIFVAARVP